MQARILKLHLGERLLHLRELVLQICELLLQGFGSVHWKRLGTGHDVCGRIERLTLGCAFGLNRSQNQRESATCDDPASLSEMGSGLVQGLWIWQARVLIQLQKHCGH